MQIFKNRFRALTTAIAIGVLGIGFTTTASATAIADISASLSITLDSVTDIAGNPIPSGADWVVDAEGYEANNDVTIVVPTLGPGFDAGAGSVSYNQPFVILDIGDSLFQSAWSHAEATYGGASTFVFSQIQMSAENLSGQALTFNFDYDFISQMAVSGSVPNGDEALGLAKY